MLEYICVQSALLFVIINIYSVYSIYFGVGHFIGDKGLVAWMAFYWWTKDGVYKPSEQLDTL